MSNLFFLEDFTDPNLNNVLNGTNSGNFSQDNNATKRKQNSLADVESELLGTPLLAKNSKTAIDEIEEEFKEYLTKPKPQQNSQTSSTLGTMNTSNPISGLQGRYYQQFQDQQHHLPYNQISSNQFQRLNPQQRMILQQQLHLQAQQQHQQHQQHQPSAHQQQLLSMYASSQQHQQHPGTVSAAPGNMASPSSPYPSYSSPYSHPYSPPPMTPPLSTSAYNTPPPSMSSIQHHQSQHSPSMPPPSSQQQQQQQPGQIPSVSTPPMAPSTTTPPFSPSLMSAPFMFYPQQSQVTPPPPSSLSSSHSGLPSSSNTSSSISSTLLGFAHSLDSLPDEMLSLIFSWLSVRDIGSCAQVCNRWKVLSWKSVDHLDLSQTWNFYTKPKAARLTTDKLLGWLFTSKLDPKHLTTINAWGCESFNNNVLEVICRNGIYQRNLKSLNIHMTSVTSQGLRTLVLLINLERLTLISGVFDRDIGLLCSNLMGLQHLLLMCSNISDFGIRFIVRLPQLKELQLTGCERITDVGIAQLSELKHIRSLSLSYTGITDVGLQYLTSFTQLHTLSVSNCKITDLGLRYLALLPNLTNLSLSYCYMITDAGVVALSSHPKLVNINLTGCNPSNNKMGEMPIGF